MPDTRCQQTAVFSAFALALPLVSLFAPAGTVVLLLIAAALAWLSCPRPARRLPWPSRGSIAALAVLLTWSAITAIWAFDPLGSLFLSVRLAGLFAAGFLLYAAAETLDEGQRNTVGRWLTVGLLLGLAILVEEIAFDYPLMALIKGPEFEPSFLSSRYNRGATALAMLSWPTAAYLWQRGLRWPAMTVLFAAGVVLGASESLAAGFAMAAGALTILVALAHRHAGRILLLVTSIALLAAAPFVANWLHELDWQNAAWLPETARQRVDIWYTAADLIAEKPLLGWGFDASRAISRQGHINADGSTGLMFLHPHNAPLQVILELGAVGGAIAIAILWVIAIRLDRFPNPARLFGQACFAATLAIACTAYGVWQNHWLATVLSTAVLVAITRPALAAPKI